MSFVFDRHPQMPDVVVITPRVLADERGWFSESYRRTAFAASGIDHEFVQQSRSRSSKRGILRGLHFQLEPFAQGKLVQCAVGAFFDVAVDIRRGSPTFAKWVGTEISAEDQRMVWIPPGFAHGAMALTDGAELVYLMTAEYRPMHERAIRWNDPAIGIDWPIGDPLLSPKDAGAPALADCDNTFVWRPR